jgi:hypothetical protein
MSVEAMIIFKALIAAFADNHDRMIRKIIFTEEERMNAELKRELSVPHIIVIM